MDQLSNHLALEGKNKMLNSDLKPCPFCGGEASLSIGQCDPSNLEIHYVECLECASSGAWKDEPFGAAYAWNQRNE